MKNSARHPFTPSVARHIRTGSVLFLQILLGLLWQTETHAQNCTTLGQTPGTAFPVCGTSIFRQESVPVCGNRLVPARCGSDNAFITDKNPFFYSFTCFESGTLGFLISPLANQEDYDWQLFDITGKDPESIYTDPNLFVACNWSGEFGLTGTKADGTSLVVCVGLGQPLFSAMPQLVKGHKYLLLVSHFTDTQSGYTLTFSGGTAVITDPAPPALEKSESICSNTVSVKLNKRMRCTSLAANGSDFTLSPASADIVSARGINCSGSFDMDSLVLDLSRPLDPGTYTLTMRTGLDGNTILDNCDNGIPEGQAIPFTVSYSGPAPFDSIAPFNCSAERLSIVFSKGIQCSSLAADASDFRIEGPYPVSITKATANCTQGETQRIELQLSAPLTRSGTFSLRLQAGTDGNTLVDACGQSIPAGSSIPFSTYDAVSAKFDYRIGSGCQADTLDLQHNTNNGVNNWVWTIDGNRQTGTPGLRWIYRDAGNKQVRLDVSNGYCSDSATVSFSLDVKLKAAFEATSTVCPEDSAFFRDQSTGGPIAWSWDFNNGRTSEQQSPPAQSFRGATTDRSYYPSLTVRDNKGCVSRVTGEVRAIANCTIEVPTAFTPNGDGLNDYLYPLNAFKANKLLFRVYNRYGQLVFESRDGQHKWDGRINGLNQGTGQYAWTLEYTIEGKDKIYNRKGVTTLIR